MNGTIDDRRHEILSAAKAAMSAGGRLDQGFVDAHRLDAGDISRLLTDIDHSGVTTWWDQLSADLTATVFYDTDLAEATGLLYGSPKIAKGRNRDGWQQRACEAMADRLAQHGFTVLGVLDPTQVPVGPDNFRAPIGGVLITRNNRDVICGVRVDPVGEVYPVVDDPNDPRLQLEHLEHILHAKTEELGG